MNQTKTITCLILSKSVKVGENIFGELNHENLDKCSGVCQNWKTMLEDPKVWLTICVKKAPKHVGMEVGKFEASKIHIDQWMALISKKPGKARKLLKLMHQNEIEKSFKPPIYMTFSVNDFPLSHTWDNGNYSQKFLLM